MVLEVLSSQGGPIIKRLFFRTISCWGIWVLRCPKLQSCFNQGAWGQNKFVSFKGHNLWINCSQECSTKSRYLDSISNQCCKHYWNKEEQIRSSWRSTKKEDKDFICDFRRLHMDDFELSKGMDFEKVKGLWKNSDSDEAVIITYRKSREHVYEFSGDIYYFSYKHKT